MENLHKGHRKRVKEKFHKSGLSVFEEHEVLELILFYAVPQRDTNELAHKLKRFGSVRNVLEAPYELLRRWDRGKHCVVFKLVPCGLAVLPI